MDRGTRDERAVKVMNVDRITSYYLKWAPSVPSSPHALLRKLHTEVEILREVDHPNIVKLQDVFFGRRSVYLVTDLCRGGELYELLTSGKNQGYVFREDRASRLMRDMLSSIHYLHRQGIVHRDLKLENFLFEGDSATSPLIMIDFGLSKHFDPNERMNQRVGSCYYTAPEVLAGDYDYRCDVWSLGVICYMLLSGSPPFYGPPSPRSLTLTWRREDPRRDPQCDLDQRGRIPREAVSVSHLLPHHYHLLIPS
jgi:serine/threonine protein kinase